MQTTSIQKNPQQGFRDYDLKFTFCLYGRISQWLCCFRLNTAEEAAMPGGNSLFVCDITDDQAIQRMIDHSRDIAHWVAAEIVGCSSSKVMGILESSRVMG